MYTEHFGLKQRPLCKNAAGTDVFVGPQTASVIGAIKKALAVDDAVIAISGPVGAGKTTVVKRALGTVGKNRIIVFIGRLQLGYDEVIELLLAGLGARQMPKSTVQRFALFRRLLHQHDELGNRVLIVVEDAAALGISALAELEALTAEDSGASSGASLVLMGTSGLAELLRHPELARLKQRIRLRQSLAPLAASELRGYLKHCFRLAGGEFDEIFEPGADETLYRFSDGIPRVCNSVVDQVLASAAEQGLQKIPVSLIEQTVAEEIGLTVEHSVAEIKKALTQAEVEKTAARTRTAANLDPDERRQSVEVVGNLSVAAKKAVAPVTAVEPPQPPRQQSEPSERPSAGSDDKVEAIQPPEAATAAAVPGNEELSAAQASDDDIPELIQDTLPDLEVLAPDLSATMDEPAADPPARQNESVSAGQSPGPDDPAPMLQSSAPAGTEAEPQVPDWERDPTLAELRPDLEALERAMALAQRSDDEPEKPVKTPAEPVSAEPAERVPEITLDREIQAKIDEATEALRQTQTDIPTLIADDDEDQSLEASLNGDEKVTPLQQPVQHPAEKEPPAAATAPPREKPKSREEAPADKDRAELDRIASQLSQARSLEDVDDKLAETLFGEEFSMLAAEVAASAEPPASANEDFELSLEPESPEADRQSMEPAEADSVQPQRTAATAPAGAPSAKGALDPAASERLATVRALNQGVGSTTDTGNHASAATPDLSKGAEAIVMSSDQGHGSAKPDGAKPSTIEEQMNTSMTQTLNALNARNTPVSNDDDEDAGKKGFFSRFRRS